MVNQPILKSSFLSLLTFFCSLAGMLEKVGLLPAFNNQQIPLAYKMYTSYKFADNAERRRIQEFKDTFGIPVEVKFMGLWYFCFCFYFKLC